MEENKKSETVVAEEEMTSADAKTEKADKKKVKKLPPKTARRKGYREVAEKNNMKIIWELSG